MTFSSKSDEHELPQVGEVWLELGKASYRVGETPAQQRLWLVVDELPSLHGGPPQLRLLQLESGGERRINMGKLMSKKFPWKRFASPDS